MEIDALRELFRFDTISREFAMTRRPSPVMADDDLADGLAERRDFDFVQSGLKTRRCEAHAAVSVGRFVF
jgi:hypothetical protein